MLHRRPLALCCIAFVLGCVSCALAHNYWLILFFASISASAVCIIRYRKDKHASAAFIAFGLGAVFCFCYDALICAPLPCDITSFDGEVRDVVRSGENRYIEIKTEKIGNSDHLFRLYGYGITDEEKVVEINDVVRVEVSSLHEPTNKMKADGVDGFCTGTVQIVSKDGAAGVKPFLLRLRGNAVKYTENLFEGHQNTHALLSAVLLGDKSKISEIKTAEYRRVGLSHFLSISGLHFSILMSALHMILTKAGVRFRLKTALCVVFAIAYTAFAGMPVSAVRAALMCVAALSGRLFKKRSDSFTSLSLAMAMITAADPYAMFDLGAQFSFLSCFGLIVLSDALDDLSASLLYAKSFMLKRVLDNIALPILLVVFATMLNVPVMLLNFDYFSVIAPVTNVLLSFIMTLIMIFGVITLIIGALPFIGTAAVSVTSFLTDVFENVISFFSKFKNACISTGVPGIKYIALITVIAILFSLTFSKKRRNIAFLICGLVFLVTVPGFVLVDRAIEKNSTKVVCGGADNNSVIVCANGEALWFDGAKNDSSAELVYSSGFSSVKYYFADIADEEGFQRYIRLSYDIPIEKAFFKHSAYSADPDFARRIRSGAEEFGTEICFLDDETTVNMGECRVEIYSESADTFDDSLNMYVVSHGRVFEYIGGMNGLISFTKYKADVLDITNCGKDIYKYVPELLNDGAYAETIDEKNNIAYLYGNKKKVSVTINKKGEVITYKPKKDGE